jgi:hypothetical protein
MQTQEHTQNPINDRSWEETRLDATGSVLEGEDYTPAEQMGGSSGQSGAVQEKLSNVGSKTKQAVTETMDEAKGQVQSTLSEQKSRAADQLSSMAGALRQTGRELENQEQPFAQYADAAADQIERLSSYIKERDFTDLWNDLQMTARRQPELFVAGALAAGFLVGRFLKSSGRQGGYNYNQGGYNYNTAYNPGYNTDYNSRQYDRPMYSGEYGGQYGGQTSGQYSSQSAYGQGQSSYGSEWSRQQSSGQDVPLQQTEG